MSFGVGIRLCDATKAGDNIVEMIVRNSTATQQEISESQRRQPLYSFAFVTYASESVEKKLRN